MIPPRPTLPLVLGLLLLALGGCSRPEPQAENTQAEKAEKATATAPEIRLLFTYGSEKEKWIEALTAELNAEGPRLRSGERVRVETVPMGSGQAIDEIFEGRRQPHLVSPASAAFIELGNARSRATTGGDLVGRTQSLVLSPVVIGMWKSMAEALGHGQKRIGWAEILEMSRRESGWAELGHPEWGAFKLGHTHPELSNSGLIALFAQVYAGAGKVAGLKLEDVERPAVGRYLEGIQASIVHYGTSTGFFGRKMFDGGPGYLSAAVLYENMVIESYNQQPAPVLPLVAIYPKEGTFWSDHPIGLVERPWVSEKHREAADLYIRYLLARPQQERAIHYGFRPADPAIALGAPFDAAHGVDAREPQTTLPFPSVEVMDAIRRLWHERKKKADVVLVFDRSGSMKDHNRMPSARDGALRLLSMLHDQDSFSLLPFSDQPTWAVQQSAVGAGREDTKKKIEGLFPEGGTALYDAIAAAYGQQRNAAREDPRRIRAIVVLTDGEDTRSEQTLQTLLARLEGDKESQSVRIFTIGYGAEANRNALERIAEATQARFFEGRPENIREVFFEISTFF